MHALVSVIVPTFNPAPGNLERAIATVLEQPGVALELIVVDDGSKTPILITSADPRIRLIRQDNGGVANARNTGVAAAQGEFVAFLDDDDTWMPGTLKRRLEVLRQRPTAGAILSAPETWFLLRDLEMGQHRPLTRSEYCHLQQRHGYLMLQGSLVRREIFEMVGPFDENLFAAEDQDFLLRVLMKTEVEFLQEAGFLRVAATMTANPANQTKLVLSSLRFLDKHEPEIFRTWAPADIKAYLNWRHACIRSALRKLPGHVPEATIAKLRSDLSTPFNVRNLKSLALSAKTSLMKHFPARKPPGL